MVKIARSQFFFESSSARRMRPLVAPFVPDDGSVDTRNHLVYRLRAQQQSAARTTGGGEPKERRRGGSSSVSKFQALPLVFQVLVLVLIVFMSVRRLFNPPPPTTVILDDGKFAFVDGKPGAGCLDLPSVRRRSATAFSRALVAFNQYAPSVVLNASSDFSDWTVYINEDMGRRRAWDYWTQVSWPNFLPGLTVVDLHPPDRKRVVAYKRVWKSGNDAIRMNLVSAAGPGADLTKHVQRTVVGKRKRGRDREREREGRDWLRGVHDAKTFTFVREPIEHWAAAYRELEFRWFHEGYQNASYVEVVDQECERLGCVFNSFPIGSTERVWAFLGDLLLGKLRKLKEVEHVYPQRGVLGKGTLDFIGRLERFDEDWEHVVVEFMGKVPGSYQFDHSLGTHNSSTYAEGRAAKDLVDAHDVAFLKVLQELLVLDYLCLGYPLPFPMEEMEMEN